MKYNYQNISISKDFYKSAEGFSKTLERLDPSEQYRGTEQCGRARYCWLSPIARDPR